MFTSFVSSQILSYLDLALHVVLHVDFHAVVSLEKLRGELGVICRVHGGPEVKREWQLSGSSGEPSRGAQRPRRRFSLVVDQIQTHEKTDSIRPLFLNDWDGPRDATGPGGPLDVLKLQGD